MPAHTWIVWFWFNIAGFSVLVSFWCCEKQHDSPLGKGRFVIVYMLHWGKSGQEPKEELETETMEEHCLVAWVSSCLAGFLVWFSCMVPPNSGLGFLHPFTMKTTPHRVNHRPLWHRQFLRQFKAVSNWFSQLGHIFLHYSAIHC